MFEQKHSTVIITKLMTCLKVPLADDLVFCSIFAIFNPKKYIPVERNPKCALEGTISEEILWGLTVTEKNSLGAYDTPIPQLNIALLRVP